MIDNKFISIILKYKWKILLIVFVNLISLLFSIMTMMLIEPLVKLVFVGNVADLSVIGTKLMQFVALFVDVSAPKQSLVGIVLFVAALFFLKNTMLVLTQWLLAPVRSDVVRDLRNKM